jgi:hypothetical protein
MILVLLDAALQEIRWTGHSKRSESRHEFQGMHDLVVQEDLEGIVEIIEL